MAYRLPNAWRSLLGQQAVTTGRSISPNQAAALRQGELEAAYNISGTAEDRALKRKQIEDQLAIQNANLSLQQKQVEGNLANQQAQIAMQEAQMGMENEQFAATQEARDREFARQMGLNEQQFTEQQAQNREQNRLTQEQIGKSSRAAETSGYIQAATAIPTAYMAYSRYNEGAGAREAAKLKATADKLEAQNRIDAARSPQAVGGIDYSTNTNYDFFNNDVPESWNYGDYNYDYGGQYNYPYYDYSNYYDYGGGYTDYPAYDYGGTDINYDFFNSDYDFSGMFDFLGW